MPSKNLGLTKSCPECKKTLLKEVNLDGKGILKVKCPHCKTPVKVKIEQKTCIIIE